MLIRLKFLSYFIFFIFLYQISTIISFSAKVCFGISHAAAQINVKTAEISLQEEEWDILNNQDIPRLIIAYDRKDNVLDLDEQDILVHESLHYQPTHAIALTSLSDWQRLSEIYEGKFDQIIFYHVGVVLESFVDTETDFTSFMLVLNKILKPQGKIIFKSVKVNAHYTDVYGYDINYSRSQLVNYMYDNIQKIHNFKNSLNIAKKYLRITNSYMKLCKKFNLKLNYIGVEQERDADGDSMAYFALELEKLALKDEKI